MKEKSPLPEALREFYKRRKLNKAEINKFLQLQQTLAQEQKSTLRLLNSRKILLFTTSSSFVFLCLLVFQTYYFYSDSEAEKIKGQILFADLIEQNLVNEISSNYNKQLTPEIRYSTFEETKKHFTKLDFTPVVMKQFKDHNSWKLIGARYENINGNLGIIYTVFDKKLSTNISIFQTIQPEGLNDINKPVQIHKNGVNIHFWTEKGLLVGIAE